MFHDNGIFGGFQVFQGFGAAELTSGAGCGNLKRTQEVLDELGYSVVGKADGIFGPNTQKALSAFAKDHGFSYDGKNPSGQICEALQMAWNAAHPGTGPLSPPPPGTVGSKLNFAPILKTIAAMQTQKQAAAQAQAAAAQQAAASAGPLAKVKAWWGGQSTMVKVGLVGGVLVLAALGAMAATSKKKTYTANKRRSRSRKASPKSGSCRKKGVKGCRCKPPKGYPRKRSAYALPECFMYPVNTKKRTRTAAARFGKHARRYPKRVKATIRQRIDRAKKRFHIGQYR